MPYGPEQKYEIALTSPAKYFTPAVVTFILMMIAGHVLSIYWKDFVLRQLALDPWNGILRLKLWQLVTYLFVDPNPYSIVWNCSCVLIVGSALEREWGSKSFVALWFIVGVTCALIWTAIMVAAALLGHAYSLGTSADGAVYGLLGAFGLAFRRQRFLFFFWGMEAQVVVLILVVIGVILGLRQPAVWIWVAGAGVAFVYVKLLWKMRDGFSLGTKAAERARFKDLG